MFLPERMKASGMSRTCGGLKIPHLCHKPINRAIAPTVTAAPAWLKSTESGRWPLPVSAPRPRAWSSALRRSCRTGAQNGGHRTANGRPAGTRGRAHDRSSHFWSMADMNGRVRQPLPALKADHIPLLDDSHVAMRVNLDACIHCNLCVRACREVQVNDVIGMSFRGHDA